ncbi:hypothetical protein [Aquabacterium sp.]|uniref:hypothetical protein n=1 Tax=Aquabacterium sp. TaxID=1872578 RepID=UPI003D6D490A
MFYFSDKTLAKAYRQLLREFRNISGSKLIVTAAFGGIDDFLIPAWYMENGFQVVVITDRSVVIENCTVITVQAPGGASARLFSKLPKILLPRLAKKAELAIWVDANISFNPVFFEAMAAGKMSDGCLTYFEHSEIRSPLLEGVYCLLLGKDRAASIFKTFFEYLKRGQMSVLVGAKINACGILLWRPKMIESKSIAKFWLWLVMTGSIRDQISFPLAVCLSGGHAKVMSWGIPYNHAGMDAPLKVRPHVQGNGPVMTGWQKYLVSAFSLVRRFRKRHFIKAK